MVEFIFFLMVFIILIQIFRLDARLTDKTKSLNERLDQMANLLIKIRDMQQKGYTPTAEPAKPKDVVEREPTGWVPEKPIVEEAKKQPPRPVEKKPEPVEVNIPQPITAPQMAQRQKVVRSKPAQPGFFERNPDLEKFIGENLANKIGIAILVLGIGFFVKYAIDQNWIGVYGRVFIGVLCGGILIGVAHYLRKSFTAFSSVLVGGGIAIVYVTIYIAFHEYRILSQEIAFAIMVLITGFTILLSVAYNRIELAVFAILGGFASPFMASSGEGNYVVLFTYIMILDAGMLVLAYFKKWNLVNIIAYVFTIILFGSWLTVRFDADDPGMVSGALIFATFFYFTFFVMNVVNNLKLRRPFQALDFGMLLSNTFLYFAAGMAILSAPANEIFRGLFTAALAVFNFVFAFSLYRRAGVDRNLVFLLIGLVLTFISLAAPIQLEGNYITLFWAAETAVLLWLSQKSGIRLMKIASAVVMVLMWISLAMDWYAVYYDNLSIDGYSLNVLLNKGYVTGLVAVVSVTVVIYRLRFEVNDNHLLLTFVRPALTIMGLIILYVTHLLELTYHLNVYVADFAARSVIIGTYNMVFILALILAESRLHLPAAIRQSFALWGVLAILSYFFVYHGEILTTRYFYISGQHSSLGFLFHYILVTLLVVIASWSLTRFGNWKEFNAKSYNLYAWFFVFFFVFLASSELDHTVLMTAGGNSENMYRILHQNGKIGYPILWGVSAFILIAVGLRRKRKHLRIISLTLLLITLLKLFLIDIKGISEGGKIAAFISLGILLLVVSFMYQRLKKLWLGDDPEITKNEKEA